jgi:hypothetical protein
MVEALRAILVALANMGGYIAGALVVVYLLKRVPNPKEALATAAWALLGLWFIVAAFYGYCEYWVTTYPQDEVPSWLESTRGMSENA